MIKDTPHPHRVQVEPTSLEGYPDLLTTDEVAALLRISQRSCYSKLESGAIPSVKVGRRFRVRRVDLERMLTPSSAGAGR